MITIPIPFLENAITVEPTILWQAISTLIAFSVVIFTMQEKSFAWILNIFKKLINFFVYYSKGLYAKLSLDLILILNSAYGFYKWGYRPKKKRVQQNISALTPLELFVFVCITILIFLSFSLILYYTYATFPQLEGKNRHKDSFHAACSIVNYYLLAQKKREAWLFSLAGQVAYALLFLTGLEPFAVKYIGYMFLSIRGFYKWDQAHKKHEALKHATSS